MKYQVVSSKSKEKLELEVNNLLNRGWETVGPCQFVYACDFDITWLQTMVKKNG